MVSYYTLARIICDYDPELAMDEDAIRRDGCMEIFPPRWSEGLLLRLRPVIDA